MTAKEGFYEASGTMDRTVNQAYARANHHKAGHSYFKADDGSEESATVSCACGWAITNVTLEDAEANFEEHQRTSRRRYLP